MTTRPRVSHLTTAEMHNLDIACEQIHRAFGAHPYLVGSADQRKDWRDVDVRLILDDDHFDALFGSRMLLWSFVSHVTGEYLRARTGLPIDFQIQRQTEANEKHDKQRNPLGMHRIYAGGGDLQTRCEWALGQIAEKDEGWIAAQARLATAEAVVEAARRWDAALTELGAAQPSYDECPDYDRMDAASERHRAAEEALLDAISALYDATHDATRTKETSRAALPQALRETT